MADTLTEEKLSELAEALAVDKNLPKLGLKLGFKKNKVDMYLGINNRNDSFDGTSTMLFDWKKKTPRINRISDLKKALIASDLTDFAEDFFPEEGQQQGTATGSSSAAMSASTSISRREVTDEEIDKLSKMLPDKEYKRLGSILGFHFNYAVQILKKNLNDYRAAFEEILQEWNNKGGSMEDLDAALMKADLGKLVSKYKN